MDQNQMTEATQTTAEADQITEANQMTAGDSSHHMTAEESPLIQL